MAEQENPYRSPHASLTPPTSKPSASRRVVLVVSLTLLGLFLFAIAGMVLLTLLIEPVGDQQQWIPVNDEIRQRELAPRNEPADKG